MTWKGSVWEMYFLFTTLKQESWKLTIFYQTQALAANPTQTTQKMYFWRKPNGDNLYFYTFELKFSET